MKVLHVISDENIGGAGVLLTTLLKNMDRKKVESIVAMPKNSLLFERISSLGIEVIPLYHPCDRVNVRSIKEMGEIIKKTACDLVHTNAALCARIAAKKKDVPIVYTKHCCFPPRGIQKKQWVRRAAGKISSRYSNRIVATAAAAAEELVSYGIKRSSIELIINGSEAVRTVSEMELDAFRKKWKIQKDDFCIGICARIEECKGHDVFLKAAKTVLDQKNEKNIVFFIVGDGSMRETIERQVKNEGISNHVRFLGFVEDMAPVYRILNLNVNCSRGTETSCLALSEGMSASVPFIATDYGGNADMKGDSNAGMLFAVNDDAALARSICRIMNDSELYQRMRRAAYERYHQKYTAVQMSEHLMAVYEDLLGVKFPKEDSQR